MKPSPHHRRRVRRGRTRPRSSGAPASAQADGKPIITIGLQQGIDNLNPIRGYTVAAFEAWNMQ